MPLRCITRFIHNQMTGHTHNFFVLPVQGLTHSSTGTFGGEQQSVELARGSPGTCWKAIFTAS